MKRILFLLAALVLPMQDSQPTVVVPIQNASFEQGTAGWQFGPSSGITQSNGKTVAYAGYGGTFSQDLGISPMQLQKDQLGHVIDGVYTLKFSIANYFPPYPGYYEVKVSFGAQELCDASGWGTRNFSQISLVCPSPDYFIIDQALQPDGPAQGASNLKITFTGSGWLVLFKGDCSLPKCPISLTFTPD